MTAPANVVHALPQYQVGSVIGAGGMGVVYAGVHRSLGRHVAIKQLPAELLDKPGMGSRFDREAKVLASLDHPHIVPVYDYVQTGRDSLLVMEKLDGGTVFDRFHGGGVTPDAACAIVLATLAGLHAAHRAGVLHLDVKPKNLLFTRQGVLKVADFGIAQVISEGATLVTHGGEVLGTPAYISPEQASGNPLTPAADVYSAGTVLYELLSGTLPFATDRGALSMMRQHIFGDPRPISNVPAPLARVVMRSLARETDQRYRDAEAFAADLAAAADATFGHGWLQRTGIPVHLTPRVTGSAGRVRPTAAPEPTLTATHIEEPTPERKSALLPALVAALSLLAMVAVAFLSPNPGPRSAVTQLSVTGVGPGQLSSVDLSLPIPITGGPATMSLSFAGFPIASASGQDSVQFPALTRWLVGGTVTGKLTTVTGSQEFPAQAQQFPLASAMGAGSLLACLFALAYLESMLRTVRRGRGGVGTFVGAVPLGALLGSGVWLLVAVLTEHEPSLPYGIGCAVTGVIAAMAAVWTTSVRTGASRA
ncbi:serine/threonine-protein kinase [Kutzneria buriramensis]|uniref:non-specific serine/threonine protein kinase n=1 Tax=Kutzneria buriramensis TaxID=1045776 RepID=A0A3E0H2F2_9PSEU|nr:serine/threonine-protein kinase [Kutzneria buriramensis]REH37233.1 serine/threonine-protein kinase [Kutzneria buriramensis]